jgi:hypothetical protein
LLLVNNISIILVEGACLVKKRTFPLIAILLLVLIFGAFFMLRAPVILVTDPSFTLLYGSLRTRFAQAEASLRLGRRVLNAAIVESASSDVIALAIKSYAPAPYAVLFPYRYAEGARRYKAESPGTRVLILEGRVQAAGPADEDGPLLVATDTRLDFYRAGLIAAELVKGTENGVMVFQDGSMDGEDREAFLEGLKARGFEKNTGYLSINADISAWHTVGCVVVIGPAIHFFEKNLKIPAILFTWADPRATPWGVKAVFDDSVWALAVEAVNAAKTSQAPQNLPSKIIFPSKRTEDKETAELLKKFAREVYIGKSGEDL